MRNKVLLWLCAVTLLITLTSASASAELTRLNEGTGEIQTVIYYVPSTADETRINTAHYVAETIAARRGGQNVSYAKFNAKAFMEIGKVFSKGNAKGSDQINEKLIQTETETTNYDIWFIVPQEAAESFINNEGLMNQCRAMLANEQSRMHVVLITERETGVDSQSALGLLAAEGKTDWILLYSDFLAESMPDSADDLHTGNYLFPALYGTPADLILTPSEDGASWTFQMPQNGDVFVLVRWDGKTTGNISCHDSSGYPVQGKSSISVKGMTPSYSGALLDGLAADGQFTISCQDGAPYSVTAYWYPNLSELTPELDIGREIWKRGSNELILRLGNTYQRPEDFIVRFNYQEDDTQGAYQTAIYDSEQNAWVYVADKIGSAVKKIYVTPSAAFRMKDGNLIWKWQGERKVIDVESEGVSEKSEAPESLTLYYDGREIEGKAKAAGFAQYQWSQFFNFNAEDKLEFAAEVTEGSDAACISIKKSGETKITFKALTDNEKPNECHVLLTGKSEDQEEAATHILAIRRINIADLFDAITCSINEKDIPAGGELTVTAILPAETATQWDEAQSQLEASIPDQQVLSLVCRMDGLEDTTDVPFEPQEDGSWKAETKLDIPTDRKAGNTKLNLTVDVIGKAETISFNVRNDTPEIIQQEAIENEVCLEGFPWAYQQQDNMLATVFGTDRPFEFFRDPEDLLSSVNVKVTDESGSVIQEETINNPEDQMLVPVKEPGNYEIRMIATDGVNQTEEIIVPVKVYSQIMRYVSYAAAGLLVLLLLLVIILIIRHARKPSFGSISIRGYVSSDEEQEYGAEILSKCTPVPMAHFGKKGVTLNTALILCRQPSIGKENTTVADDILILPTKHNELNILFGKNAMKTVGRHEKRELLSQGHIFRMRIGNMYILIENVLPG